MHKLEIDFEDLDAENKNLSDVLTHKPGKVIPLVSLIFINFGAFLFIVRNWDKTSLLRIRPK